MDALDLTGWTDADRHRGIAAITTTAHAMRRPSGSAADVAVERRRYHRLVLIAHAIATHAPRIPAADIAALDPEQRDRLHAALAEARHAHQ